MRASKARLTLLCIMALPTATMAWGADGHRVIAEIAWERLAPTTQGRVRALLDLEPGASLVSISTWADELRSPTTASWHYINFEPEAGCTYSAARDCPDGQCVVAALERQAQRLRTASSPDERLRALKWVVHLVGDIHQPLHAGPSGSKGGNLVQVRAFGRGTNLHAVWDSGLIKHWPGGLSALRETAATAVAKASGSMAPQAWAMESCRIATAPDFQPEGRVVGDEYEARWSHVLAARMQAAAERLAKTLEAALP